VPPSVLSALDFSGRYCRRLSASGFVIADTASAVRLNQFTSRVVAEVDSNPLARSSPSTASMETARSPSPTVDRLDTAGTDIERALRAFDIAWASYRRGDPGPYELPGAPYSLENRISRRYRRSLALRILRGGRDHYSLRRPVTSSCINGEFPSPPHGTPSHAPFS
jgi:hypothetical protein